ncbi:MAG: manganese efflux pump MntP family protein [Actinomycetota bacterium]|jgi:putative Mn2+ efflux pump MntP|nr:manganese efflux pump MntP family protein [Actinomycetota bacterium]
MLSTLVKTAVFVLPLGLDVLSVSTALGTLGLTGWARWRVSLVLASCQIGAMLAGLVLGAELAEAIGEPANYVGAGVFIVLGIYLLLNLDISEAERVRKRISENVLGLIGLGISISPDEFAVGFALGLAGIPVVAGVVAIGLQGVIASQLGLFVGARLGARFQQAAGLLASIGLVLIGLYQLVEQLTTE